jgi:hypothetical protein
MNKILIVALFFALATCNLDISKCTTPSSHDIDTSSKDYKYYYDFDWTDEDEYDFKVPFISTNSFVGDNDQIIPMFINASAVDLVKKIENEEGFILTTNKDGKNVVKINDVEYESLESVKVYGQRVFFPFDGKVSDNVLSAKLTGTTLGAEAEDVTRKFRKYFAYAECKDVKEITIKISTILATFNNGNYFSISKILLASLALLFL